jgi:hypothetical protein
MAKINREKQIRSVQRAIKNIEYEETIIPAPEGISDQRWRAMIKSMYLNGEPK